MPLLSSRLRPECRPAARAGQLGRLLWLQGLVWDSPPAGSETCPAPIMSLRTTSATGSDDDANTKD